MSEPMLARTASRAWFVIPGESVGLPRKLNTPPAIDFVLFEIRRYIDAHDEDGVVDLSGNPPLDVNRR